MLEILDHLAGWWLQWRTDQRVAEMKKQDPAAFGQFTKAELNQYGVSLTAHAPGLMQLANEAVALLNAHNAKSYIEFDFFPSIDNGVKPVRVTIQYAYGESPAIKAVRLETELEQARNDLADARKSIAAIEREMGLQGLEPMWEIPASRILTDLRQILLDGKDGDIHVAAQTLMNELGELRARQCQCAEHLDSLKREDTR